MLIAKRPAPLDPAAISAVRRSFAAADMFPPKVFHDPEIFAWERDEILRREWRCVGREEELPEAGSYRLLDFAGEQIILIRGEDNVVRAFHNACRHRGATLIEGPVDGKPECGTAKKITCPYHAWVYSADGTLLKAKHTENLERFSLDDYGLVPVRCETWQGFVFLTLESEAEPLLSYLDDLVTWFDRFDLKSLRRAKREEYDVAANWKILVENYSECYHCPGVHPQLNALTPYDLGEDIPARGWWKGGWQPLVGEAATMGLEHGSHKRPWLKGVTDEDARRIHYFALWPNMLLSLHPDYLMVHVIEPVAPGRSLITCDWYVHPDTLARPDFDFSDAHGFWDQTNRQDWHVCTLQQRGTASQNLPPGRYSELEASVQAFDLMVADRYAADGVRTARGFAVGLAPGDMEGIDFSDRSAARASRDAKISGGAGTPAGARSKPR